MLPVEETSFSIIIIICCMLAGKRNARVVGADFNESSTESLQNVESEVLLSHTSSMVLQKQCRSRLCNKDRSEIAASAARKEFSDEISSNNQSETWKKAETSFAYDKRLIELDKRPGISSPCHRVSVQKNLYNYLILLTERYYDEIFAVTYYIHDLGVCCSLLPRAISRHTKFTLDLTQLPCPAAYYAFSDHTGIEDRAGNSVPFSTRIAMTLFNI
nr:hypothetical protein Iba_chr02aCG16880 [Ipomoea batatas]